MAQRKPLVAAITDAFQRSGGDGGQSLVDALYGLAGRFVGRLRSSHDINDLVGHCEEKVCELFRSGKTALDIANQLPTIMENRTFDIMRGRSRVQGDIAEADAISNIGDPAAEALYSDLEERVRIAYKALEEHERIAVDAIASGRTYAQVLPTMAEYGVNTDNHLGVIVFRARKKLREMMRGKENGN
jgi:DNA-directed RNA polymerase specialized sigma24 family protein